VEVVEGENYGFSGGFNSSLFDFGNTFRNSLFGAVVVMRPMHHIEFLKGLVPLIVGGVVFLFIGAYMMRPEGRRVPQT